MAGNKGHFRTTPFFTDITFANPSSHKVWRSGSSYTGTLTIPSGYSGITWEIVNHDTLAIEATGTGTSVTHTFTFAGTDNCNTYALRVTGTKSGHPDLNWVSPGEFTCLPAIFTQGTADVVWDLGAGSVIKDGLNTDRGATGYKIWLKGTCSGTQVFNMFSWVSTNPLKPIHVICSNANITSANGAVQLCKFGSNQNLIIDGCTDEAIQYGLQVNRTGGATECAYITADNGATGYIVCGVHVDNGVTTAGGSGFVIQMFNGTFTNDNVYRFRYGCVFNCLVENTHAEGFYVGHTIDTASPPFAKLVGWKYYRCNSNHTNNEGFQMGGHINTEVFKCDWQDAGLSGTSGQINDWVWRDGNQNVALYMNHGKTTQDIVQLFNSTTGLDCEFFSNYFESSNASFIQGWLIRLSEVPSHLLYYGVFNNLIRVSTGPIFQLYNDPTFYPTLTVFHLYADGNVLLSDTTTNYQLYNSFTLANSVMNNLAYTSTATPLFVDPTTQNYRPASTASPLLGFTRNSTATAARAHWLANYDFDGYKYMTGNLACGPFSGWNLYVL